MLSSEDVDVEAKLPEVDKKLTSYLDHVQYYIDHCRGIPNSNTKFHTLATLVVLKDMTVRAQGVQKSVSHHLFEEERAELQRCVGRLTGDEEYERNVVHLQKLVIESIREKLDLAAKCAGPSAYPSSNFGADEEQLASQNAGGAASSVVFNIFGQGASAPSDGAPQAAAVPPKSPLLNMAGGGAPQIGLFEFGTGGIPNPAAAGGSSSASAVSSGSSAVSGFSAIPDEGVGAPTPGSGAGGILPQFLSNLFYGAPAEDAKQNAHSPLPQFFPIDGPLVVVPGTTPPPGQLQAPNLFAGMQAAYAAQLHQQQQQNAVKFQQVQPVATPPQQAAAVGPIAQQGLILPSANLGIDKFPPEQEQGSPELALPGGAGSGFSKTAAAPETANEDQSRSGAEPEPATQPIIFAAGAAAPFLPTQEGIAVDLTCAGGVGGGNRSRSNSAGPGGLNTTLLGSGRGTQGPLLPPLDPNTFSFFAPAKEEPQPAASMEEMMSKVMSKISQPFEFKPKQELTVRPIMPPNAQKIKADANVFQENSGNVKEKLLDGIKRFNSVAGKLPPQQSSRLDPQPMKFLNVENLQKRGPLTLGKVQLGAHPGSTVGGPGAPPAPAGGSGQVTRMGTNYNLNASAHAGSLQAPTVGGTETLHNTNSREEPFLIGSRDVVGSRDANSILNHVRKVDPNVEYWSATHNRYIPAVCLGENPDGTLRLDVKMAAPADRVRLRQPQAGEVGAQQDYAGAPQDAGFTVPGGPDFAGVPQLNQPPAHLYPQPLNTQPILTQPHLAIHHNFGGQSQMQKQMQPTRGASGVVAAPGATRCSPGEQQEQCQQRSQSNTNSSSQVVGAGIVNSYIPQMQPPSMEQPDSSSIRRSQVHQQGIPNIGLSNLGGGLNVNGAAGPSVPGSCVSGGGGIGAKAEDKAVEDQHLRNARRSGQLVGGEGPGAGQAAGDVRFDQLLDTQTQHLVEMHKLGERFRAFSERCQVPNEASRAEESVASTARRAVHGASEVSESESHRAPPAPKIMAPQFLKTIDELHAMLLKLLEDPSLSDNQREALRISDQLEDMKRMRKQDDECAQLEADRLAAEAALQREQHPQGGDPDPQARRQGSKRTKKRLSTSTRDEIISGLAEKDMQLASGDRLQRGGGGHGHGHHYDSSYNNDHPPLEEEDYEIHERRLEEMRAQREDDQRLYEPTELAVAPRNHGGHGRMDMEHDYDMDAQHPEDHPPGDYHHSMARNESFDGEDEDVEQHYEDDAMLFRGPSPGEQDEQHYGGGHAHGRREQYHEDDEEDDLPPHDASSRSGAQQDVGDLPVEHNGEGEPAEHDGRFFDGASDGAGSRTSYQQPREHVDKCREFYRNGRTYKASYSTPHADPNQSWSPPKRQSQHSNVGGGTPSLAPAPRAGGTSTRPGTGGPKRMFSGRVADNAWMRKRNDD
eukprot:CAMPEP_0178995508 /NCGR_PEP_ID=MMETSP0795-20121207/7863_1 /TAXON_ID=88552 /ORGANISM="Amoebophrya sp., Strain Ameob2" /LENGTH=1421 /DNA_ID=CAMNT_0020687817 /DNA_START=67 /DNA_END=4335 /DNA_ORIENTATION=-